MNYLGRELRIYGLNWLEVIRWWVWIACCIFLVIIFSGVSNDSRALPLMAVGIIAGILVTGIFLEWNPKRIVIYEEGVGYRVGSDENTWRWAEITDMQGERFVPFSINGIPALRVGSNDFYCGTAFMFKVTWLVAQPDTITSYLLIKMAEARIPDLMLAFDRGEDLTLCRLHVNQRGIGNQTQRVSWGNIDRIRIRWNKITIYQKDSNRSETLSTPGGIQRFELIGLLDQVRGTNVLAGYQEDLLAERFLGRWDLARVLRILGLVGLICLTLVLGYILFQLMNPQ